MNIRSISEKDLVKLRKIHARFYADEFEFPDFDSFVCNYIIEDSKGIITAGGIRLISECILLTDKSRNVIDRKVALGQSLNLNVYYNNQVGLNGLHAFIQDPIWEKQLIKHGFQSTKGKALFFGS